MVNKFHANVSLKAFKYTTEQKSISNEINKMIIYFRFFDATERTSNNG
jgi:hypothetical protein